MTTDRAPKKTEAIELRVSPEEKAALKARAAAEGVTVSSLIRSLVTAYLAKPLTQAGPAPYSWRHVMTRSLTSPLGRVSLIAAACTLTLGWIGMAAPSAAQDVAVDVFASITQGEATEAVRHTGRAELALDFGAPVIIPIGQEEPGPYARFAIEVHVDPGPEGQAVITTRVIQISADGVETELAAPRLMAAYGETATFRAAAPEWGELEMRTQVTPEG